MEWDATQGRHLSKDERERGPVGIGHIIRKGYRGPVAIVLRQRNILKWKFDKIMKGREWASIVAIWPKIGNRRRLFTAVQNAKLHFSVASNLRNKLPRVGETRPANDPHLPTWLTFLLAIWQTSAMVKNRALYYSGQPPRCRFGLRLLFVRRTRCAKSSLFYVGGSFLLFF